MTAKVLFVDDDPSNLVVCEAACSDEFEVITALSAAAALKALAMAEVGVIVADQRMPETTGVELLERVRHDYPDTVRVLITAYSDMPAAIEAINRGQVRRYLKKPWVPEELKTEIRDALEIYQMTRKVAALELRLRETERVYALGVAAASIGHEMRNPISWISNNLSYAQGELAKLGQQVNVDDMKARVREVEASLVETRASVNNLLDIVRSIELPSRSDTEELQTVDVAEVLRLSMRLVSGELRRRASLELDVTCAPKVRGSSTKLGQLVLNLVINAIQAMAHRSRADNIVSLRLRIQGEYVLLEVADNGPGIGEQEIERIFDPFYTSKPGVGTGLGLAICRRIAQDLRGTLEAGRDEQLGGARFVLRLPLS